MILNQLEENLQDIKVLISRKKTQFSFITASTVHILSKLDENAENFVISCNTLISIKTKQKIIERRK